MPDLRYHAATEADTDSNRLRFPDLGSFDSVDADTEHALELAKQIESSLDDLQDRLDRVKEELDEAYRFPTAEDLPPSAA